MVISDKASSCINPLFLQDAAGSDQIEMIIQVNAKAHIYRNNTQPLSYPWGMIAATDIKPAVFFVQAGYPGIRVFNDISHFKILMT